jgi:hypothetical protein
MSDQGEEGQVPEPPGLEGRGESPPRPTVRESLRRGLFVRLPTEGDAEEGSSGAEQSAEEQSGQGIADQYPEQVADPYPGWRQAADGSWEAVGPEAYSYAETSEPAAPAPEVDQNANFASVAGGEPFIHEETSAEVPAWPTIPEQQEAQEATAEAVVPVTPQSPEVVSGVMPEAAPVPEWPSPEPVPEEAAEVAPEPVAEAVAEPVAEVVPEPVAEAAAEPEAAAEVAAAPEKAAETPAETTPAVEDPIAGTDLYIPSDVELLEDDMRVYGEKENVPPRFAGSGLGEPYFIEFDDLSETLSGLRRLLPKGARLTYNYDYERAWVRSSADIDLASFAERLKEPAEKSEKASS